MASSALTSVLVDYLLRSSVCRWPGADGLQVGEVIQEYPAAVAARQVPGELALCERHPNLAPQIVAFFFLLAVADADHA